SFTQFLNAVERAGYRRFLEGKGIVTVMAPDDQAFAAYLTSKQTSVSEMELAELKKLVGFHLLYYSYSRASLENFRPEGDFSDGATEVLGPGMYYKFRTRSSSAPTKHIAYSTAGRPQEVTVYHLERFIPVFSHNFFKSKGIADPAKNYEYFYPGSKWTGDDGFNVSEASVVEYEQIANNGYVYIVDKVLEPLETIYAELEKRPEYSLFLSLFDRYGYYEYDATLSSDFGAAAGVDSLYLHKHTPMPNIASEWPVSSYLLLDLLSSVSFSVFPPTNEALTDFFNNYWAGKGYESIQSLDPLVLQCFLYDFFYAGSIVFPEQIEKKEVLSQLGTPYNFDPYSLDFKKMCVNGNLYGLNTINMPSLFSAVTGPAFQQTNFVEFLYTLEGAGTMLSYANPAFQYTFLMPNTQAYANSQMGLIYGSSSNSLVENPSAEEPSPVSSSKLLNIVNSHVTSGNVELKTEGTQVVEMTNNPYNYWFIKDGEIASNQNFNRLLLPGSTAKPFTPFKEVPGEWTNGRVYEYEATVANKAGVLLTESTPTNQSSLEYALFTAVNNPRYVYYGFAKLLSQAGMLLNSKLVGVDGRYITFIPSNASITQALKDGKIPGAKGTTLTGAFDQEVLAEYMRGYFIPAGDITTYPYPGSNMKSGKYTTLSGSTITYTDNGSSLSVQAGEGKVIPISPDYHYFPFAFNDGAFHFINEVF
ncbi:fasciclin domain-containing protein, partial [Bacteroidales bacterium OttesenSCG-928-J19]|nr:fasciclin domain-containing protein [Bacteroidales bacterium OttesenSCG-928-J19]